MKSHNRIIINTIAQYVRSIANMLFSLIATRFILKNLGVDDYGIYTLIAGVVSMISFMSNALVVTTQRYLSVSQGIKDNWRMSEVFNTSFFIHLIIAIAIFVILEVIFPFLFNGFLIIPEERLGAAKYLYQTTVAVIVVSFISSPYRASIISHENIVYTSIIEIVDGLLKLVIAIGLSYIAYDKLKFYGTTLVCIYLFNLLAWIIYAKNRYLECKNINIKKVSLPLVKEIMGFATWTIYTIGCVTGRSQGIAIIINKFMGAAVNAAYGLALQVSGAVITLSQSLLNAINPQLMKAEGAGDRNKMLRFSEIESKFAFFMLTAMVIPSVFEMPQLLELWLGTVPEYAVMFCRMTMLATCMDMLTIGLNSANQAIGDIKRYSVVIYTVKFSTLLFVLFSFLSVNNVMLSCIIYVVVEFVSSILRIPFLFKTAGLDVKGFVSRVFRYEIFPIIVLIVTCYLITYLLDYHYRFLLTFVISVPLYSISIYAWGLAPDERNIVNKIIYQIKNKLIK